MIQVMPEISAAPVNEADRQQPVLLLDDAFIDYAIGVISRAKRSIDICAYSWGWYENSPEKKIQQFNHLLSRKARTGVRVRAILHQSTEATAISRHGIDTRTLPTERIMHTKAILSDGRELILGSHNLTERGTRQNYECSIYLLDHEPVYLFREYFDRVWENYAV